MDTNMKTGDKLAEGYKLISEGKWEGSYLFLTGIAELYLNDEVDDVIYGNYLNIVANMNLGGEAEELNQWLKLLILDVRFGKQIMVPGDLLENIRKYANELNLHADDYIVQAMLDGSIGKIKWLEDSYITIKYDYEKQLQYLVRIKDNQMIPLDFDVEDFRINRPAKRIEFNYLRGYKHVFSINVDGSDKRGLERTDLYPEIKDVNEK